MLYRVADGSVVGSRGVGVPKGRGRPGMWRTHSRGAHSRGGGGFGRSGPLVVKVRSRLGLLL